MLKIGIVALLILAIAFLLVLTVLTVAEKSLQRRHTVHRRRMSRGMSNGWRSAMMDALRRMLGDPATPPAAEEMTVVRAQQPVISDPEMPGLPNDARPLVRSINEMIIAIDRRIGDDVLGQPLIIEVEQLRDRHLPKLLRSYVEIPAENRREMFAKTGKSASVHLSDSLKAIRQRLEDISRDLSREHLDTFEDNARFITRTYGRGADDPLA
jgi:hypothetical protein